jgi:IS30 family transposase
VGKIPNRVDITKRPAGAENRSRCGHWEADTVVSRNSKEAVAVFVERKNRYYIAVKMKNKTAEEMLRATIKALGFLPSHMRRSITFDNGLENALHEKINTALGTRSYFCKPYHSWEKGSIENRNGILRRYFPKKHNWGLTTQKELNSIIGRINNTPMKCLRFRTPSEVFAEQGGVAIAD